MNKFVRVLNNLGADKEFLFCKNISIVDKVLFIINKYTSIIFNRRNIKYLGYNFEYDDRITPLILQFYPSEINSLDKYIIFNKIYTVLDIGANIGQWAFTAKAFFPQLKIYSFEPNKVAFLKLTKNSSYFKNWEIYNYAIGRKTKKRSLFYTNNSTIGGSFYKNIAGEFLQNRDLKNTSVSVINPDMKMIKNLGLPFKFDLVKIDVEGAELEVLESLKQIDFKYLIIEIPVKSRRKVNIEKINKIITTKLNKKANLLYIKPVGNLNIVKDAVYKLTN